MNTPEIKIIGLTRTGKSALAFAIKHALESYGIQVAVTGCEDERKGVMEESWKGRLRCLKGEVVVIETSQQNAKREPCDGED